MTGKGPGRIVILRGLCEVSVDLERLCYPFFDLACVLTMLAGKECGKLSAGA
jgi:hypothetical protein